MSLYCKYFSYACYAHALCAYWALRRWWMYHFEWMRPINHFIPEFQKWTLPSLKLVNTVVRKRGPNQKSKQNGKRCRSWWNGSVKTCLDHFCRILGNICVGCEKKDQPVYLFICLERWLFAFSKIQKNTNNVMYANSVCPDQTTRVRSLV